MKKIYTIGHGTKPIEEFLEIMRAFGIEEVIDVRSIPRSRHNPQYDHDQFVRALSRAHVGYLHVGDLGGLRSPKKDSVNTAWRNRSFRGFADYMQSQSFLHGIALLLTVAREKTIVLLCGETLPWRCHRSLIADALAARKIPVLHIFSQRVIKKHELTPFARVKGLSVTYPE